MLARQVRMPVDIQVTNLFVCAVPGANIACLQVFRVRGAVVEMRGPDLDVPTDCVNDQWQHSWVVDQVEKGIVMG